MRRVVLLSLLLLASASIAQVVLRRFGDGLVRPPEGLRVDLASLDFGRVTIGEPATGFVIATNVLARPVVLRSISAEAPFEASASDVIFEPGTAKEIPVVFDPEQPGDFSGILHLESDAFPGGVYDVALHGLAAGPPELALTPRGLDFGEVPVGGVGRALLTLSNRGASPLQVAARSSETVFAAEPGSGRLEPGETTRFEVQFRPLRAGKRTAALSIASNQPGRGEVVVPLEGSGVDGARRPAIEVSATALEFGRVAVGARAELPLTVRNVGADALTIASLSVAPPFTSATRSRTLAPSSALQLPVTCEPRQPGMHFAPLVISSNDPAAAMVTVMLLCDGQTGAVAAGGDAAARGRRGEIDFLGGSSGREGFADSKGASGQETGSELPDASDTGAADGTQAELGPGLLSESSVHLASFEVPISDLSHDGVAFDPASRQLSIRDLRLPTVDGGINGFYSFDPVTVAGTVSGLGEFDTSVPVTFHDGQGSETQLVLALTTDTAVARFQNIEMAFPGRPLDHETLTLIGAAQITSGPLEGQMLRVKLDVRVR